MSRVVQINENSVVLDEARASHMLDDLVFLQRAILLEHFVDNVAHDARSVAPFGKCIKAAANEYKARILDELVMCRRDVRLLREECADCLRDFREVHRGAVALDSKIGVVADAFYADGRCSRATPLGERVAADVLGEREPTLQNLLGLTPDSI